MHINAKKREHIEFHKTSLTLIPLGILLTNFVQWYCSPVRLDDMNDWSVVQKFQAMDVVNFHFDRLHWFRCYLKHYMNYAKPSEMDHLKNEKKIKLLLVSNTNHWNNNIRSVGGRWVSILSVNEFLRFVYFRWIIWLNIDEVDIFIYNEFFFFFSYNVCYQTQCITIVQNGGLAVLYFR